MWFIIVLSIFDRMRKIYVHILVWRKCIGRNLTNNKLNIWFERLSANRTVRFLFWQIECIKCNYLFFDIRWGKTYTYTHTHAGPVKVKIAKFRPFNERHAVNALLLLVLRRLQLPLLYLFAQHYSTYIILQRCDMGLYNFSSDYYHYYYYWHL